MVKLKVELDDRESYENFIKTLLWKGKKLKVEHDEIMGDVVRKAWEEKKWKENRKSKARVIYQAAVNKE